MYVLNKFTTKQRKRSKTNIKRFRDGKIEVNSSIWNGSYLII